MGFSRIMDYFIKFYIVIVLLVAALPGLLQAESPRAAAKKGVEYYRNEEYDRAAAEFLAGLKDAPNRPELHYDLGAALYKMQNFPESAAALARAAEADNPKLAANVWYNLGNAMVKANKLDEAIQAYKNSLRLRSDDHDAKHNLETALRMKQMQMRQQQQQQSQQSDSTKNEQRKQQPKEGEEQQQQKQRQPENSELMPQDSLRESQPQPQTAMSPEEAKQLLQSLESEEQEAQKEKLLRQFGQPKRVEKDW